MSSLMGDLIQGTTQLVQRLHSPDYLKYLDQEDSDELRHVQAWLTAAACESVLIDVGFDAGSMLSSIFTPSPNYEHELALGVRPCELCVILLADAAADEGAVLLAQELKERGIPVLLLHPGFNKTGMTAKYSHIWEIEGAVDASVGAKRVLHEVKDATMDRSGMFINCEDGLKIPF